MSYEKWLDVVKQIADGVQQIPSPEVNEGVVDYRYIGDPRSRLGYLIAWCNLSKKGIHVSRVKAPNNVEMVSMLLPPEEVNKGIPSNIDFVSPDSD